MQIVIESLALAAFGSMLRATEEPLLKKLLRYVMSDEARHVAFGILSLQEFYENLSDAEIKERQEFLAENTLRSRSRGGFDPEIGQPARDRRQRRAAVDPRSEPEAAEEPVQRLRARVLRQARAQRPQLGLLDANNGYLRKLWDEAGLLQYEFADDTADGLRDLRRGGEGPRGRPPPARKLAMGRTNVCAARPRSSVSPTRCRRRVSSS